MTNFEVQELELEEVLTTQYMTTHVFTYDGSGGTVGDGTRDDSESAIRI